MGDIIYKPLIEKMTWSYSRIEAFEQCPYKFFSRYILQEKEDDMFYASYGSLVHDILSEYYKGTMSKNGMLINFLTRFSDEVKGSRPKQSIVDSYIKQGVEYFRNFTPIEKNIASGIDDNFSIVSVEEKIDFSICGKSFTGVIDLLLENNGCYYIVDHKSRALRQRSGRKKPTKNDNEIDMMLRQLYIYSYAVHEKYGIYPNSLCFNCFRNKEFIKEDFNMDKLNDTIDWVVNIISEIENTEDFFAEYEYFKCWNICGCHDRCDEFIYWVED